MWLGWLWAAGVLVAKCSESAVSGLCEATLKLLSMRYCRNIPRHQPCFWQVFLIMLMFSVCRKFTSYLSFIPSAVSLSSPSLKLSMMGKPTYVLILNKGFHFLPPCSLTFPSIFPIPTYQASVGKDIHTPLSRTIKGLRFCPTCKLTMESTTVSWMLAEDMTLLAQIQKLYYSP